MAKVITWTPPFDKPANCVATAVAGGSLPDGTYYFRVYAQNQTETRQPFRSGVISDEFSVTTSGSNNQILLTWDSVPDAPYYQVLQTTTSGYYSSSSAKVKAADGSYYYTTDTNSYTYTGTEVRYNNFHPFICPTDFPDGLDKLNGRGYVSISGGTEADPITPEDINTAIGDTTYSVYDGNTWSIQGSITGIDNAETHFQAKNLRIWMAGIIYGDNFGSGSEIIFGRKRVDYDATIYQDGCTVKQVPNSFQRPFQTEGNVKFYASKLVGTVFGDDYYISSACATQTLLGYGSYYLFKQSEIWGYPCQWYGNVVMEDTLIADSWNPYYIYGDFTNAKNIKLYGLNLEGISNEIDVYINYLTFVGYEQNNWHIEVNQARSADYYLINCEVDYPATGHDGLPTIYWDGTYGQNLRLHWQKTLNLKVVDSNGDGIDGATVRILDVDGVEHPDSPLTTDANGDIVETKLTQCIFTRKDGNGDGNGWDYTDQTDKSPYSISISKDGYKTVFRKYTVEGEINQVEALGEVTSISMPGILIDL